MSEQPEIPVCREDDELVSYHYESLSTGNQNSGTYNNNIETTGATDADAQIFALQHPNAVLMDVGIVCGALLLVGTIFKNIVSHGSKNNVRKFFIDRSGVGVEYFELSFATSSKVVEMSIYEKIIARLDAAGAEYTTEHHSAIESSAQTSHDRGMDLHAGAKAIVTVGEKTGMHYLFILPGDYKLDNAKTKEAVGEKISFAPDTESVTGCVIGSVPPFGSLFELKTFCDPRLGENTIIFFNAGSLTETIKMRYEDFLVIEKPVVMEVGKAPSIA